MARARPNRNAETRGDTADNPPPPPAETTTPNHTDGMEVTEPAGGRSGECIKRRGLTSSAFASAWFLPTNKEIDNNGQGTKRLRPHQASDDEEDNAKNQVLEVTPTATDKPVTPPTQDESELQQAEKAADPPTETTPFGWKHFLTALRESGWQRSAVTTAVPSGQFKQYLAYYTQYMQGDCTDSLAKRLKIKGPAKENWESLKGTLKLDAFARLMADFLDAKRQHGLFTMDPS